MLTGVLNFHNLAELRYFEIVLELDDARSASWF